MDSLLAANRADEVTQAARYEAFKGKNLLYLTAYYTAPHYEAAGRDNFKQIHATGVNIWVCLDPTLEADRVMAEKMEQEGFLKNGGVVFAEQSESEKAVDNIIASVEKLGVKLDAVFGGADHVQPIAAAIAERLGLPGNSVESYTIARNKYLSRDACERAGVASPKYHKIENEGDLEVAAAKVGFPMVLKPQSGAGSLGVYPCHNMTELRTAYSKVVEEIKTNRMFTWQGAPGVLVEQFIDGDEFDVDLLFWDGKCVFGSVTDNWPTDSTGYYLETGANTPTVYPADKRQELIDYAISVVKAMKFRQGCFHVECKYSHIHNRPLLIEVNARMGGQCIRHFNKEVYGVDLWDNFMMTSLGIPINPPRVENPTVACVHYDICAPKTGVLVHERFLDHIKAHPQVTMCKVTRTAGSKIQGFDTGIPEWVGTFQMRSEDGNVHELIDLVKSMLDSIDIPIVPEGAEKTTETATADVQSVETAAVDAA
eukprot:comp19286_c0_seq1/m.22117 comp19286_c0_seq1/g.22117  ORF comp19286_c0_seq1/g.22117 comp19286_c0_seq1/m.22117 type:complete len:483 (-) comp19286_c0_seq1:512-1960(-)